MTLDTIDFQDTTPATPAAGTGVGVDVIAGVNYEIIKLAIGAEGILLLVPAGQQLGASSLPVIIASDQPAIPVSAASLPLPAGASTAAKQDALATLVGEVQASPTANTVLARLKDLLTELQLKSDLTETQPVSAASLPLPAGAATSAKQDTLLTELQLKADLTETQPVSAASLPLPSGASTSAKQDSLLAEMQLKADLTETQPVSAASLPLPTGASTSAKQDSQTTLLGGGLPAALGAGGGLKIDGSGTPLPVSAAGSAIQESGIVELVGVNDQVDQFDWGDSVSIALGATFSGWIVQATFIATEDGTGAIQDSEGMLYIFDADPTIAAGDTSITAADALTVIGRIPVTVGDWDTDANMGLAMPDFAPVYFHSLSTLYIAWKHLDATSLNDNAAEDEQLEVNLWIVKKE